MKKNNQLFEETQVLTNDDIVMMARRAAEIKRNVLSLESKLGIFRKATSECTATLNEELSRLLRQIDAGAAEIYQDNFEESRASIVQAKRPHGVRAVQDAEGNFIVEFGGKE